MSHPHHSARLITVALAAAAALAAPLVADATAMAAGASAPHPGTLDPTFSNDGVARVSFGQHGQWAEATLRDAHGRQILVGVAQDLNNVHQWYALTRLTPAGSVDPTYGQGGRTMFDPTSKQDYAMAAAMAPGGKVVVLGDSYGNSGQEGYALVRFTSSGRVDRSFGSAGVVTGTFGIGKSSRPETVVVQPDGRILVAGDVGGHALVRRYLTDGHVDASFGTNGRITVSGVDFSGLVRRPDGRLVLAWSTPERGPRDTQAHALHARQYTVSGSLDHSFGVNGLATLPLSVFVERAAIQRVVVGAQGRLSIVGTYASSTAWQDGFVAAITADGKPDVGFGTSGWLNIHVGFVNYVHSVVALSGGRLVIGGSFNSSVVGVAPDSGIILLVLRSDGTADPSFGTDGYATKPPLADAEALLVAGDRLVVGGYQSFNGHGYFLAARYYLGAS